MTGHGRSAVESRGTRAAVEIRAVNHRFLDVKLRGSQLSPELEEAVMGAVRKRLERGAVQMTVRAEQRGEATTLQLDREAARRVHAELSALRAELGIDEPVTLALICSQPGVLVVRPNGSSQASPDTLTETSPEDTSPASPDESPGALSIASLAESADEHRSKLTAACVLDAVEQALAALARMRETEGAALARELDGRLGRLSAMVDEIAAHAESAPGEASRRLEERLARLLEGTAVAISPERLAQEVAMLADRLDVTEEIVRLRSHIEHTRAMCRESAGAVGRRLDFLVQEMGRELNTIASKSHTLAISRTVVDARAELEKIREQVQNIE
jgi:uncharacterized protein YicC (UPF0701 family)